VGKQLAGQRFDTVGARSLGSTNVFIDQEEVSQLTFFLDGYRPGAFYESGSNEGINKPKRKEVN